jgi:hypothetical protein
VLLLLVLCNVLVVVLRVGVVGVVVVAAVVVVRHRGLAQLDVGDLVDVVTHI